MKFGFWGAGKNGCFPSNIPIADRRVWGPLRGPHISGFVKGSEINVFGGSEINVFGGRPEWLFS